MNLDYDRYDEPGRYDFIDSPEEHGYIHESEVPDISDAKDAIRGLIEAIYITGDVSHLEDSLHELCSALDIPFQMGTAKMQTKPTNWTRNFNVAVS